MNRHVLETNLDCNRNGKHLFIWYQQPCSHLHLRNLPKLRKFIKLRKLRELFKLRKLLKLLKLTVCDVVVAAVADESL